MTQSILWKFPLQGEEVILQEAKKDKNLLFASDECAISRLR